MTPRRTMTSLALIATLSLSGCSGLGDVSSSMRVDTGLEPENIDSNVRFRTTYYFRILTGCTIPNKIDSEYDQTSSFAKRISGKFFPLNDSLYRFRMTGQAAALFNKVHFESGVLRKEQIDPFGSTVRYNEDTHTFSLVPPDKTRDTTTFEIEQFRKLYKDIQNDQTLIDPHKTQLLGQLITMIESRLEQLKTSPTQSTTATSPTPNAAGTAPSEATLTTLESQLGATESKLGEAKEQLEKTTSALDEAGKKVEAISKDLETAKTHLATPTPEAESKKAQIEALTKEYTAAQSALKDSEGNRAAAEKQVATLRETAKNQKEQIRSLREKLTATKRSAVTSLKELAEKTENLLIALGEKQSQPKPSNTADCNGKPSENRYYLLGPEGAKELDPNDRLLLALSVDSKPLISALQQLSERKMQAAGVKIRTVEDLLEERGHILDAKFLLQEAALDATKITPPTDHSKLRPLLDTLRNPYSAINTSAK